ncbi:cytochrome c oxidase subunit CcoM [Parendozoicomonas sp. Alg238-R29]|nr:cytochrome c oxidase subunit CcoM [Parendozoicomonas sp. Alg238-R29]
MPFEALVIAGVLTIGLVVAFMGGFGVFVYKDSHRKRDQSDS